jgi:hypothetical protein
VTVKVEGAAELERRLDRASADMADLSGTNTEVANAIASQARGRAPVVSGRLAGSIRVESDAKGAVVRAGSGVPYAGPIHWGWAARNIAAQPFMLDAAQQLEAANVAAYSREVESIVNRIGK